MFQGSETNLLTLWQVIQCVDIQGAFFVAFLKNLF